MKKWKHWAWSALLLAAAVVSSCKYDDDEIWDKVNSLDNRLENVENQLNTINSNISSMSSVVNALNGNVYVTSVTENTDGYVIAFSDGKTATITNGKDGADGAPGADGTNGTNGKDAPVIGFDKDTDGKYYWTQTIDGTQSWLTDASGSKVPVTGESAVTPRLKVSATGYWMISYDNGVTYAEVLDEAGKPVKAVGENGDDGYDGDSWFDDVDYDRENGTLTFWMDGEAIELKVGGGISSPGETIAMTTEGIGDWDEAYVTPYGYFCYSEELPEETVLGRAATEKKSQKVLAFSSLDSKTTASMLLSATEELPLQLITDEGTLNFSYPNDSILELVYDNGTELKMLGSIRYSRKDMEATLDGYGYTTHLQKSLYFLTTLVKGRLSGAGSFDYLCAEFTKVLSLKIDVTVSVGGLGLPMTGGSFSFAVTISSWYKVTVINKVYHSLVMWTGDASYKVGGSSCTLSGTIWCPSETFNDYGTYGIVCDTDIDKLTLGNAEYEGEGFQDRLKLSYEVDFRGLKPNTTYYYRAYYKFNSTDHGNLKFKYGDKDAQVGYDYVIKSFNTGDNTLNVDVVMCIDATGSMGGIINTVKANALSFYDSFKKVCVDNGIGLTSLNTQVIAFRDKNVDGGSWLQESPTYSLPDDREQFDTFVNGLYASGGGDTPESGLEALERAFLKSDWGVDDGYHRQVVILWTDAPYLVGDSYTSLTVPVVENMWNSMPSGRRFILFAPNGSFDSNGGDWANLDTWKNVIHLDNLSSGFGDLDYILENIIGELTGRSARSVSGFGGIKLVPTPNY